MTRSQSPNGEQSGAPAFPPGQYPAPQYPAQQYPAQQYPAPGPADRVSAPRESGPNDYGQPAPAFETPTVGLQADPAEYQPPVTEAVAPQAQTSARPSHRPTRIGAAWVALIVAAIVLIFLLIFILQNSGPVQVRYFGFEGTVPLGVAMLFAAVAGALTAGLLGTVKILQMRKKTRRALAGK